MRQEIFENALKGILNRIKATGSTTTHDVFRDRRNANAALSEIAAIVRQALDRSTDPKGMSTK